MGIKEVIIGSVCSLCATVTDSVSGTRKNTAGSLVQIINRFICAVGPSC